MKRKFIGIALLSALTFGSMVTLSSCAGGETIKPITNVNWEGLDDIYLTMGDEVPNLLAGVKAVADNNKELTVKIDEEMSDEVSTKIDGAFTIYYVAFDGDKKIEEDYGQASRTVTVERGTYIDDNDFKTGEKGKWAGNGNAGSVMSWEMDKANEAIKVEITNSGEEFWQNQVEYNGLNVRANTTYQITVRAKSTTGRNIGTSLEVPAEGYKLIEDNSTNVVGYKTSTEYQDFKYYFTASQDYLGVKFGITLGRFNEDDVAPSTVYIDKVEIKALAKQANTSGIVFTGDTVCTVHSYKEYLDLPAVTAKDATGKDVKLTKEGVIQKAEFADELSKATFGEMFSYTDENGNFSYFKRQINYRSQIEREFEYSTLDGEFTKGTKYWVKEENGLIEIKDDRANGTVVIKSLKESTREPDWRAQLQQNNIDGQKLTGGKKYKAVVKAKTTNKDVRTLRLEFCAGAGNPAAKKDLTFSANDTFETFETEVFAPAKDVSGGALRVGLLLAEYNASYTLTVDSIQIVEVK